MVDATEEDRVTDVYEPVPSSPSPWRGTISLIYAGAMQSVHASFFAMVPDDVNLLVNTKLWSRHMLHSGSFDAAAFESQTEHIVDAARETVEFAPADFLCIGGDLIQGAMGPTWCKDLSRRVEEELRVPTLTALEAVVEALRHLDASRIALVSPFPQERSDHLRGYLDAEGFDVAVARGVETTTNATIRDLPFDLPYELTGRALAEAPDVDAVYLTCPVWRSNEAIAGLEDALGIPVVTMLSPIVWKGLEVLGYDRGVHGYGRLLEGVGRA